MTSTEKQLKDKDGNDITDANAVHKTGNETVGGVKVFSDYIVTNNVITVRNDGGEAYKKNLTTIDMTTTPSANFQVTLLTLKDKNNVLAGEIYVTKTTTGKTQLGAKMLNSDGTDKFIILAESD